MIRSKPLLAGALGASSLTMLPLWAVASPASVASLAFTSTFSVRFVAPAETIACWAAICRSWAAAAQHGAQAARHRGREPTGVVGARGRAGMASPARGPGRSITLGLLVPVRDPDVRQIVLECCAHRGLLDGVARFGRGCLVPQLISSAGPVPRLVPPSPAASGFTTRDRPRTTPHKPARLPRSRGGGHPDAGPRRRGIGRPGGPGGGTTMRRPPVAGRCWQVTG